MQAEPTRERGDPPGPQYFPTGLFLLVALFVLVGVIVVGGIFVTAGIGGMLVAAAVAIAVGVPLAIHKMRRPADNPRSVEEEAERQHAAEPHTLPPPETSTSTDSTRPAPH